MSANAGSGRTALEVQHDGIRAVVRRNEGHPEQMMWIEVGGKTFFLGTAMPGMTRGDVKRMALQWLREREK